MNYFRKSILLLSISLLFISSGLTFAQEESQGLIISEIYLDKEKPSKSWIEIYNPTEKQLTLEAVRYSHVKTPNMLPDFIQNQGGIVVNPKECIVLSGEKDEKTLNAKNDTDSYMPDIANFDSGGFFALTTKNLGSKGIDVMRYGDVSKSAGFKEFANKKVVGFSNNGKSFSRKAQYNNGTTDISEFFETNPTKGLPNN